MIIESRNDFIRRRVRCRHPSGITTHNGFNKDGITMIKEQLIELRNSNMKKNRIDLNNTTFHFNSYSYHFSSNSNEFRLKPMPPFSWSDFFLLANSIILLRLHLDRIYSSHEILIPAPCTWIWLFIIVIVCREERESISTVDVHLWYSTTRTVF